MVNKILIFLKKGYENKNAFFVSTALIFPFFFILFKWLFWYKGFGIIPNFLHTIISYIFTLVAFCFLIRKEDIFYSRFYKKIPFLFYYFYTLTKMEIYFCKDPKKCKDLYKFQNKVLGFFLYSSFLLFYLYLLSVDSFFIHLRIPLLCSYSSFFVYFYYNFPEMEKYSSVIPNIEKFRELHINYGINEENKNDFFKGRYIYAIFFLMVFVILLRKDGLIGEHVKEVEQCIDSDLEKIAKMVNQSGNRDYIERFQYLEDKKKEIFCSVDNKLRLYKISLYIFSFLEEPQFEKIYNQIKAFYAEICF